MRVYSLSDLTLQELIIKMAAALPNGEGNMKIFHDAYGQITGTELTVGMVDFEESEASAKVKIVIEFEEPVIYAHGLEEIRRK